MCRWVVVFGVLVGHPVGMSSGDLGMRTETAERYGMQQIWGTILEGFLYFFLAKNIGEEVREERANHTFRGA